MSHVRLHKTGKVIRACGHQRNAPKSVMHVPSSCFCFIKIITFHVDMRNYSHLVWPDAAQSWKKSLTLKWLTESIVLVGPSPRSYSFTPVTVRIHVHMHRNQQKPIECFHSRGQHLCKFIGTKESVCIRKEFNSQRIVLGHQYGRRDVMWKHSIKIWRSSVWIVLSRLSQPLHSGVCTLLSSRGLRATWFVAQLPVYPTHNKLCFPIKNLHKHCLIVPREGGGGTSL